MRAVGSRTPLWLRFGGCLAALASGLAVGLAHPPFGLLPGLLGLAVLVKLLDDAAGLRRAFLYGWCAGFSYFLVGTWWIGEAFFVDAAAHGWQAPFAVSLLPAGLGLFWGAGTALYWRLRTPGSVRVLTFAAILALVEWLRGHVLSGFPWNLVGEAWRAGSAPSQAAALIGVYGLTLVTIAIAAAPATLMAPGKARKLLPPVVALATLVLLWGGGAARLAAAKDDPGGLRVRIVQPNIPQAEKWSEEAFKAIVDRYIALTSAAPGPDGPAEVVIWPESAIPAWASDLLAERTWTRDAIVGALRPGQTLLFGVVRAGGSAEQLRYYNSLLALRRTANDVVPVGIYDKHRLVPFGEYLPLEGLLAPLGLKKLAALGESFSPGPTPRPLELPTLGTVQPLICYESLFPELSRSPTLRPSWIVNVSNDAWFGRTSGPWQHLNLASYRAIEEGVPLVRATPTGVSAVVDGYGRIRSRLALGEAGTIDARLPRTLAPTPFSRFGDLPFWLLEVGALILGIFGLRQTHTLSPFWRKKRDND